MPWPSLRRRDTRNLRTRSPPPVVQPHLSVGGPMGAMRTCRFISRDPMRRSGPEGRGGRGGRGAVGGARQVGVPARVAWLPPIRVGPRRPAPPLAIVSRLVCAALLMTPVDSLDTMILMGLDAEAQDARTLISERIEFDRDIDVSTFEITIRLLGGLLASYELTRDRRLLDLARDLGTRLLPAFGSPTGLPYRFVNLRTGAVKGPETNPAEAGTLLLEFGTLSRHTKDGRFYETAKRALLEVYDRRSSIGLVGQGIHAVTGGWTDRDSHVSACIDSYYEYLLKGWVAFGDLDCRRMWLPSVGAIQRYLADDDGAELWYRHADMLTGEPTATVFGALDAFFPAVLALSGDIDRARRLYDSCYEMWMMHGIEPERFDYRTKRIVNGAYPLRPEVAESTYYLYQLTGDPRYREMGEALFESFVRYCRSEVGYASLRDVVTKEQSDEMHSFCLSETLKYFYLLFAPPETLDFRKVVFTTEAHPIQRWPGVGRSDPRP